MSFGQALYFGIGGYFVAKLAEEAGVTSLLAIVPVGMAVGLLSALFIGWFLLIGKRTPTIIFVALGTLTASFAAERLVAGWQWVGAGNGLSIWDFLTVFGVELEPGIAFYYLALSFLVTAYAASRFVVRSQFGLAHSRYPPERGPVGLPRLPVADLQAAGVLFRRLDRRLGRCRLRLPRRIRRAGDGRHHDLHVRRAVRAFRRRRHAHPGRSSAPA